MGSWRGQLHSCVASLPLWCCSEKAQAAPPLHLAVVAALLLLMVLQQAVLQPWSLVDPPSVLHLYIDTVLLAAGLATYCPTVPLFERLLFLVYEPRRLDYLPEQTQTGLAEARSLPRLLSCAYHRLHKQTQLSMRVNSSTHSHFSS